MRLTPTNQLDLSCLYRLGVSGSKEGGGAVLHLLDDLVQQRYSADEHLYRGVHALVVRRHCGQRDKRHRQQSAASADLKLKLCIAAASAAHVPRRVDPEEQMRTLPEAAEAAGRRSRTKEQ